MQLSIREMRRLLGEYHAGREVPRWVKTVMEPEAAGRTPAAPIPGPQPPSPRPAPEASGPEERVKAAASRFMEAGNMTERISAANELASMMDSITDRALLVEAAVYCNHKILSHLLLERVGDDAPALARIHEMSVFGTAAAEAMERLSRMAGRIDEIDILVTVAEKGTSASAKAEAAAKLAGRLDILGPASLKAVAVNSGDELVRSKAVERLAAMAGSIGDPSILKIIAVHSDEPEARRTAICGLSGNFGALKTVATCSRYGNTRLLALGLLRDTEDVMEVALKALDDDVGSEAARYLSNDVMSLVRIYEEAPRKAVRDAAAVCLCAMAGQLFWVKPLKIVVLNGEAEQRMEAVEKLASMVHDLDDRHALIYVAMWGREAGRRLHALNTLSGDKDALGLIAQMSEHEDSKKLASRMLSRRTDPGFS